MTDVVPIDPNSDADIATATALMTEVWQEALGPDEPPFEVAEMADMFRNAPAYSEMLGWIARDGERPVGFTLLRIDTGRGNDDRAWVLDLWVRPDERRRGIGRLLLDAVVAAARDRGRTLLDHGHQVPHDGAEGFAKAVGCTAQLVDDQNRVATAALDRAMLDSWAHAPDGYSLVAWDNPCPDELLEAFVRLQDVMNTAPMSDTMQPEIVTADMVRDAERRIVARGADRWIVAARHDASGELAGYTELVFERFRSWLARQGDTGVVVAHRGHGIGRWLKAVNALRLLDERSDVQVVETWNASSNEHMLAINHAMGFRCVAQWREVELTI